MKIKKNYDIFLSYTSTNIDNAKKLALYLSNNGFDVWFDSWNLIAGDNLETTITTAIRESEIILVFVDSNLLSSYTMRDIEIAIQYNKKILPVFEKNVKVFDLPNRLQLYQNIFIDYNNLDMFLNKLRTIDENFNIKYLLKNGQKEYYIGQYLKALEYSMRALEIQHKVLGEEHPSVATSYNNLASIYQATGDYNKALEYSMRALEIQHKVLGEEHPSVATSYNNLASIYDARGDLSKALEFLKKSLQIQVAIGDKSGECTTRFNIGHIYFENDEKEKALKSWKKVYAIATEIDYAQALEALEGLANGLGLEGGLVAWAEINIS